MRERGESPHSGECGYADVARIPGHTPRPSLQRRHQPGDADGDAEPEGTLQQVFGMSPFALLEVAPQHLSSTCAANVAVVDQDGDLEIQPERAVVQIGRADGGQVVVDQDHLVVHESRLVAIDLDIRLLGFFQVRKRGQVDQQMVGVLGQHDADVDAAKRRQLQGAHDLGIGHEVGAGDPQPLLGRVDHVDEEQPAGLQFIRRPGG